MAVVGSERGNQSFIFDQSTQTGRVVFNSVAAMVGYGSDDSNHLPLGPTDGGFAVHYSFVKQNMSPQGVRVEAVDFEDVVYPAPWFNQLAVLFGQVALSLSFGDYFNPGQGSTCAKHPVPGVAQAGDDITNVV